MDWTYAGLFLLGTGILVPWNAFISAADFFESRHPGRHSDRLFTVCYLPVQLATLLLLTWQHGWAGRWAAQRIKLGFSGFTAIMVLVVAVEAASTDSAGFGLILLAVAATGVLDGIAQGALIGESSKLPPRYTQAIVTGTAISGTAASLLRVATKAAFSDSPEGLAFGAYLYFSFAAALCLCCTLYTSLVPAEWLVQQHALSETPKARRSADLDSDQELELPALRGEAAAALTDAADATDGLGAQGSGLLLGREHGQPLGLRGVLRHTWALTASLVLIYIFTLSIFPGFLAEDVHSAELGSWYPVLLIAGFNVCDLLGKSLPLRGPLVAGDAAGLLTLACCTARLLFVPAFLVAATLGVSPAVVALLTATLGVSNGFLTSVAMVGITQGLAADADRRLAGNLAVLALVGGLSVGAGCGFLWLL